MYSEFVKKILQKFSSTINKIKSRCWYCHHSLTNLCNVSYNLVSVQLNKIWDSIGELVVAKGVIKTNFISKKSIKIKIVSLILKKYTYDEMLKTMKSVQANPKSMITKQKTLNGKWFRKILTSNGIPLWMFIHHTCSVNSMDWF